MKTTVLTRDNVLQVIQDSRNKKRKIWTASIILDRIGLYRWGEKYENYQRNHRIKAKKVLKQLWIEGLLVKKIKPNTRSLFGAEDAYMRLEDAPTHFYISCEQCNADIHVTNFEQNITKELCKKCK